MLEKPKLVDIIKKCGLSIKRDIKKMLKMERRNEISVNVVNKIPIREYGREKIYQTSKYITMNNGAYYVNND